MYIPPMLAVMLWFRSRKRLITPSRLQSKSSPVRSMSFRQFFLNFGFGVGNTAKLSWLAWIDYPRLR